MTLMEFTCSPCICVGFLPIPVTGVSVSALQWTGSQSGVFFLPPSSLYRTPLESSRQGQREGEVWRGKRRGKRGRVPINSSSTLDAILQALSRSCARVVHIGGWAVLSGRQCCLMLWRTCFQFSFNMPPVLSVSGLQPFPVSKCFMNDNIFVPFNVCILS